jgi:signal transduction histidine kinase
MEPGDTFDKPTVLVVDDTPDNLSLMSGLLKGDYKVKVANTGEKALQIAHDNPPDLILLDVLMPGLDGRDVCARLKEDPRTRNVPVIFLTSSNEECEEALGLSLGAVDYITKPFSVPITMARIRNHTRLKQQADRLEALARESARLTDEAQRATRAREEVLAIVAHDLRNPLSTILMSSRFLQETAGPDPFLAPAKLGERIHRAASRMECLIKDLLDLAAIEAGHLGIDRRPVHVQGLVTEAIEMMLPLATAKGVHLTARVGDPELQVSSDRARVLQVFSNLIGNAVKFTPAGQRIIVFAEGDESAVRFAVEDTGPGIAADQLPHIFDRYWQARTNDRRGIGLGLSIASGIVAAHGGRIWVESQPGKGSCFTFLLPGLGPLDASLSRLPALVAAK